jgi:hypothetical protein
MGKMKRQRLDKLLIIGLILFGFSDPSYVQETGASEEQFALEISSFNPEYQFGAPIVLDIKLKNIGKEGVPILKTFLPEGWLVNFTIRNAERGALIYQSPSPKVEMTAATLETIFLEPGHFWGTQFKLEKTKGIQSVNEPFPPGDYIIEAQYKTAHLSEREGLNIPIGVWRSNTVKIRTVEREEKQ